MKCISKNEACSRRRWPNVLTLPVCLLLLVFQCQQKSSSTCPRRTSLFARTRKLRSSATSPACPCRKWRGTVTWTTRRGWRNRVSSAQARIVSNQWCVFSLFAYCAFIPLSLCLWGLDRVIVSTCPAVLGFIPATSPFPFPLQPYSALHPRRQTPSSCFCCLFVYCRILYNDCNAFRL